MVNPLSSAKGWVGIGAALFIVASVGGGLWQIKSLSEDKAKLELTVKRQAADLKRADEILNEERAAVLKAQQDRTEYLAQIKEAEDETQKLRSCLADGTCGLRIRATCPTVPKTPGDTTGAEAVTARLDPAAERSYTALLSGIKKFQAMYALCIKDLESKSSK